MAKTSNPFEKQIQNRNYLSPIGFRFSLVKAPKVSFFSNTAQIPGLTLNEATQPTYLKDIPVPGDKMEFQDFTLRFLIDEDLENYMQIQRWMRGLGYPENVGEFGEMQANDPSGEGLITSDATLLIYNSSFNVNTKIHFKDVFPVSLSPVEFDATMTDVDYVTAEVVFKYSIYDIEVVT